MSSAPTGAERPPWGWLPAWLRPRAVELPGSGRTRLVETKEATQLWAERFDTELKSILQVQDEIVGRVSRAIGLQVVDIEARRSWSERPDSAVSRSMVSAGCKRMACV